LEDGLLALTATVRRGRREKEKEKARRGLALGFGGSLDQQYVARTFRVSSSSVEQISRRPEKGGSKGVGFWWSADRDQALIF